jgi:general secretion pathway protein K
MKRERGFALLIVLWTMALLTLLLIQLTASGRSETQLARNFRNNAVTEAAADGAIYETVYNLMRSGNARWTTEGRHTLAVPHGIAEITINNLAGRINPNLSAPELLTATLRELGVEERPAAALGTAIVEWRSPGRRATRASQYQSAGRDYAPPGRPIADLQELSGVLGMTPHILAGLTPHLSLYNPNDPDPAFADAVVLQALRSVGEGDPIPEIGQQNDLVVAILVRVTGPEAAHCTRSAVIRITRSAVGRSWHVLAWNQSRPETGLDLWIARFAH